ncbi:hypothetical protein DL96DRAFT_398546 [Flagelloscypha sp. PMI_526]|nr:hypothetical protein DL96DRAFT_398546 [Flagelloscypha sp. PMI_526]
MTFLRAVTLTLPLAFAAATPQYLDDTNLTAWNFDNTQGFAWSQQALDQAYGRSYTFSDGAQSPSGATIPSFGTLRFRTASVKFDLEYPMQLPRDCNPDVKVTNDSTPNTNYLLFQCDGFNPTVETTIDFQALGWAALDYAIADIALTTSSSTNSSATSSSSTSTVNSTSTRPIGAIIGGAVGGFFVLVIVIGAFLLLSRRRVMKENPIHEPRQQISAFPLEKTRSNDPPGHSPSLPHVKSHPNAEGHIQAGHASTSTANSNSERLMHEILVRLEAGVRELHIREEEALPAYSGTGGTPALRHKG